VRDGPDRPGNITQIALARDHSPELDTPRLPRERLPSEYMV
jgi:hypothetical protein